MVPRGVDPRVTDAEGRWLSVRPVGRVAAGGPAATIPIDLTAGTDDTRRLTVDVAAGVITGPHASRDVRPLPGDDGVVRLQIDGEVHAGHVLVRPGEVLVSYRGQSYRFARPDAFGPGTGAVGASGTVSAPMPGTVLAVSRSVGDQVGEGDALGVMEAMKMELSLKAPFAGVVAEVYAQTGAQVELGATLFVVVPESQRGQPMPARWSARWSARERSTRMMRLPHVEPLPNLPLQVTIYEVGPRDGLQNEDRARPAST